jgi:hypothetical protein
MQTLEERQGASEKGHREPCGSCVGFIEWKNTWYVEQHWLDGVEGVEESDLLLTKSGLVAVVPHATLTPLTHLIPSLFHDLE